MELRDKVVIVTGSSRGYGLAIVRAFAEAGAKVALTGRSQGAVGAALNEISHPGRVAGFLADVCDEAQVHQLSQKVIERFGHFDIWINNAADSYGAGMLLDMNPQHALEMFKVNNLGVLYGTQAAMRHFLPRRQGHLVNIYGQGSFLRPASPTALYGATKAWLTSFTRSLAAENKGSGVQILGFSPGMMTTDMLIQPRVVGEAARKRMENFAFALRFLTWPAEVAAKKLVQTVASQRKEFVEYEMFKPWTPLLGLLRVRWEDMTGTGKVLPYAPVFEEAYRPEF